MLLFGVGGALWNNEIETGLWKATDEMGLLHFQLRFYSETPSANSDLLATSYPLVSVCQVTVRL